MHSIKMNVEKNSILQNVPETKFAWILVIICENISLYDSKLNDYFKMDNSQVGKFERWINPSTNRIHPFGQFEKTISVIREWLGNSFFPIRATRKVLLTVEERKRSASQVETVEYRIESISTVDNEHFRTRKVSDPWRNRKSGQVSFIISSSESDKVL